MEITRDTLFFLLALSVILLAACFHTTHARVLSAIAGVLGLVVALVILVR